MSEKDLVELWNSKRSQLTKSQFSSVVALAVLAALALLGNVESASVEARIFAAVFLVSVGALSVLTQFAVIREARAIVAELSKIKNLGAVATSISQSDKFLVATQGLMVLLSAALLVSFAFLAL
jgi:asparagine N-glycosylation enzyme membrane subunit Stt3